MRVALLASLLMGCAPLVAGPGRVLPVPLQYDASSFAGKPVARTPARPHRLTLANGLEAFWVDERNASVTELQVLVRCGRGEEPVGAPGLTAVMLQSVFGAGAGENTSQAQRRALRRLAAVPEVHVDDGESWVNFTTAPGDVRALLSLVRDAFAQAHFEPDEMARVKEARAGLFDSALYRRAALAEFLHNAAIYGSVPTLSQRRTAETERALSLESLRAHAARCLQPRNVVLALTGNLNEATVREAIAPMSELSGTTVVNHGPAGSPPQARTVWLAPSTLDSRVEVTFLGPGLSPGSKERAAAEVLIAILSAEVDYELRQQFGFVYSVEGEYEVGPGTGALWLRFTTRAEVAFESVRRALKLFEDYWERWPIDPEMTATMVKETREKAQRVAASQRAFDAARARMQDGDAFDDRLFVEQLDGLRAYQLSDLFARSLAPARLQLVISGAVDPKLDWKQFGSVVLAPAP